MCGAVFAGAVWEEVNDGRQDKVDAGRTTSGGRGIWLPGYKIVLHHCYHLTSEHS